jgi:glycosyltransferase involved in cell wall biosynthesis
MTSWLCLAGIIMPVPSLADYAVYGDRRTREQPISPAGPALVSIVTVALNAAATIERAIHSVQKQTFASIEHIFVDGGSSDGTLGHIQRLARPQDYWISEKDRGISDAFNKGVALARGRLIQFLNADDWLSPDQIECAVTGLDRSAADFVFGDLVFYHEGWPIFTYAGEAGYERVIHRRMPAISHPTLLARRACFDHAGLFDPAYRNAMDYDWLLRLHRAGGRGVYCSGVVGHMNHAGISNRQFTRTIEEVKRIAIAHGRNPVVAEIEAQIRRLKTVASQPIKRRVRPLYELIRRGINRSYRPAPASPARDN